MKAVKKEGAVDRVKVKIDVDAVFTPSRYVLQDISLHLRYVIDIPLHLHRVMSLIYLYNYIALCH